VFIVVNDVGLVSWRAQHIAATARLLSPVLAAGDWDIDAMKLKSSSGDYETNLSADEKTLAEVKAACMIIDERMNAYVADLDVFQAKLEGLNERMLEAELAYQVRPPPPPPPLPPPL
jgi:hypothetical protein